MQLRVHSPDDLIAAVPHLLGFEPKDSMVLVPFDPGMPVARVDLPRTDAERAQVVEELRGPILRHATPGARLGVLCVTEDWSAAVQANRAITAALTPHVEVPLQLWVTADAWTDLVSGFSAGRTAGAENRIDFEVVAAGRALPAESREDLQASLIGDQQPVRDVLPHARDHWSRSTPTHEKHWVSERIDRFRDDGMHLDDPDAARLLVALQSIAVRDAAWGRIDRDDQDAHHALWRDLTRRAPDEVRTPAASLLAFASWLGGNGAAAWCALDQIPEQDRQYPMATLVASAVQGGLHPSAWEDIRISALPVQDSEEPPPTDLPRRPAPEPPATAAGLTRQRPPTR